MTQGAKPVLAVDVDDVLVSFAPSFIKRFNDVHGTDHRAEDLQDYYFIKDLYGVSNDDEVEPHIIDHLHWAIKNGVEIDEQAVRAIRVLEEHYEFVVITARHPDVYHATKDWLQAQLPSVFKDVHFNRMRDVKTSKPQICRELGATVLIDDHPENLQDCAAYDIQGLLFGEYFWNKDVLIPPGVQRVKDWSEVLEVLL